MHTTIYHFKIAQTRTDGKRKAEYHLSMSIMIHFKDTNEHTATDALSAYRTFFIQY